MSILQCEYSTDYYLTVPKKLITYCDVKDYFSPNQCPFYAPIVKDGFCRLCCETPINHKKYLMYNYFCRKIQRNWRKYKRRNLFLIFYKKMLPDTIHLLYPYLGF